MTVEGRKNFCARCLELFSGMVNVEKNDGDNSLCEDKVAEYNDERREDASSSDEPGQLKLLLNARPPVTLQRIFNIFVGVRLS